MNTGTTLKGWGLSYTEFQLQWGKGDHLPVLDEQEGIDERDGGGEASLKTSNGRHLHTYSVNVKNVGKREGDTIVFARCLVLARTTCSRGAIGIHDVM
jgi:hypothetical protein